MNAAGCSWHGEALERVTWGMSSALAPAAAEALAGVVERGWPWEQHSTRWQRGRQPRRCLETLPSSSPECRGPVPAPCMHNGPSVPQAQKETLSEKVRGPGIHLTQGQEEHASPCLAESQAVPVLIPIHGTFQVLRKPPMCFLSRRCSSGALHPKCQGIFCVALGQEIHSPRTEQSLWVS